MKAGLLSLRGICRAPWCESSTSRLPGKTPGAQSQRPRACCDQTEATPEIKALLKVEALTGACAHTQSAHACTHANTHVHTCTQPCTCMNTHPSHICTHVQHTHIHMCAWVHNQNAYFCVHPRVCTHAHQHIYTCVHMSECACLCTQPTQVTWSHQCRVSLLPAGLVSTLPSGGLLWPHEDPSPRSKLGRGLHPHHRFGDQGSEKVPEQAWRWRRTGPTSSAEAKETQGVSNSDSQELVSRGAARRCPPHSLACLPPGWGRASPGHLVQDSACQDHSGWNTAAPQCWAHGVHWRCPREGLAPESEQHPLCEPQPPLVGLVHSGH